MEMKGDDDDERLKFEWAHQNFIVKLLGSCCLQTQVSISAATLRRQRQSLHHKETNPDKTHFTQNWFLKYDSEVKGSETATTLSGSQSKNGCDGTGDIRH